MNVQNFKQQELSNSVNNSFNDLKMDFQNQSISYLNERSDSKQEFQFGKQNKYDQNLSSPVVNQVLENSIGFANDSNAMLFTAKQKKLNSQFRNIQQEGFKNEHMKSTNEITEIVKNDFTSMYEENTIQNNLSQGNNKIYDSRSKTNNNISKIHSIEQSNTIQSPDESSPNQAGYTQRKRRSNTYQKLKLLSFNSPTGYNEQNTYIRSLKQKFTFISTSNQNYPGEKTESNSFIGNNLKLRSSDRWNIVSKVDNVMNFINILKNSSTLSSSYKRLNMKHHELIGDKSDVNSEFSHQISNKFKCIFDNTIKKIPIFSPESPKIIFWNFLVAICILQQFVVIPLKISFFIEFTGIDIESLLFYLPAVIFILEIFIRLNISYYEEGILVESRYKIIVNYMFNTYFFWLDLITTVTFLISKDSNHPLLVIVVILRVLQLFQLVNDIDEHYQITQRFSSQWNLIKLLLLILLLAHFTGCGFHYIAFIQSEQGSNTWLDKQKIFTEDWQIRYLSSVYWASITMITVGYGDIVPITYAEKLYVIIMTLISAGVFAYSINTIGAIFGEIQKQKVVMKTQKRHISTYMRSRGINGQLQIEVLKYLEYAKQEEIEIAKKGQEVISKLSLSIQEKLFADYFGRILNESNVFKGYSGSFLQDVTQIMKEQLYSPGEIIFSVGQYDDRMLFVTKGKVQLYIPQAKHKKPIVIQNLEKGEIGHNGFFSQDQNIASLKSISVSHIVYIVREEFLQILQRFPQDHERFCQTKDQISFNLKKNKYYCFACEQSGHSINNCQRIHYKKDKQSLINKYNYSSDQNRNFYQRKEKDKQNTYKIKQNVREKLLKLRGEKMSQLFQIEFLKDDYEWLESSKDQNVFQVIPKLDYKNGEYVIYSDNDLSFFSDEINSNSVFSDDSINESSDQTAIIEQNVSNYNHPQTRQKQISQDESINFDKQSYSSAYKTQYNQKNINGKKDNLFSNIINQFNKKQSLKRKMTRQYNKQSSSTNLNKGRRKSDFVSINPNSFNNQIKFDFTNSKQTQQNEPKKTTFKTWSERNIKSPDQQALKQAQHDKDNLENFSFYSQSDNDQKNNENFFQKTKKERQFYDDNSKIQDLTQIQDESYNISQSSNVKQSLTNDQDLSLYQQSINDKNQNINQSDDYSNVFQNLNTNQQSKPQKLSKYSNKQQISNATLSNKEQTKVNFQSLKKNEFTSIEQSLNFSMADKQVIKEGQFVNDNSNLVSKINEEVNENQQDQNKNTRQQISTEDQLPYKNFSIDMSNDSYNKKYYSLEPPTPLVQLDSPVPQKNTSNSKPQIQLSLKNFITFQNLQISQKVIIEEKSNQQINQQQSIEQEQIIQNQKLDTEDAKINQSNSSSKVVLVDNVFKSENTDSNNFAGKNNQKNFNNTAFSLISPIPKQGKENQKQLYNLNIPYINSLNEINQVDDSLIQETSEKKIIFNEEQKLNEAQKNIEQKANQENIKKCIDFKRIEIKKQNVQQKNVINEFEQDIGNNNEDKNNNNHEGYKYNGDKNNNEYDKLNKVDFFKQNNIDENEHKIFQDQQQLEFKPESILDSNQIKNNQKVKINPLKSSQSFKQFTSVKQKNTITFPQKQDGQTLDKNEMDSPKEEQIIFSKEDKLKMLKKNSSMKDIFQKKQEVQKSKFAHNQYINNNLAQNNIIYSDQQQFQQQLPNMLKQFSHSQSLKHPQQNFMYQSSKSQKNNIINMDANQNSPLIPSQSPTLKAYAFSHFPNFQSSSSLTSQRNKEKKEENNGQIQLYQQKPSLMSQFANSGEKQQQQLQFNMNKLAFSQLHQNHDIKSPIQHVMTEYPFVTEIGQFDHPHELISTNRFQKIEIDALKYYPIYFPYNNYIHVIKSYNNFRSIKVIEFQRKSKKKQTVNMKKLQTTTPSKFNKKNQKQSSLKKSQNNL